MIGALIKWLSPWRIDRELELSEDERRKVIQRAFGIHKSEARRNLSWKTLDISITLLFMFLLFFVMRRLDRTRLEWVTFVTIPVLIVGLAVIGWTMIRWRCKPAITQAL